jgi:hypothetical protein
MSLTPISSTFEGKIQAAGSRNPVRLGRDPSKCHMSALVCSREQQGSHRVIDNAQASSFDGKLAIIPTPTGLLTATRYSGYDIAFRYGRLISRPIGGFALECYTQDMLHPVANLVYFLFLLSFLSHSDRFRSFILVDSSCIYTPYLTAVLVGRPLKYERIVF